MRSSSLSTTTISKKNLLSGDIQGKNTPIRPPWAIAESLFDDVCTNCGDCINACPQNILSFARGKLPVVSFKERECTFCGECESTCHANALDKSKTTTPWKLIAHIADDCLAKQKVTCRICEDPCEVDAIRFKLGLGGMATPEIQVDDCTGCGACFTSCPTQSITIN